MKSVNSIYKNKIQLFIKYVTLLCTSKQIFNVLISVKIEINFDYTYCNTQKSVQFYL